jgi:RNA polymerase sigma-70 factor (ECF subfamily)
MKEDWQLVKEYLEGDDLAFEKIVQKYLGPIYNFLRQLTGDGELANDIASETFFKVWKNLRRFNNQGSFKSWVFAIAKNTAFDFLKKKRALPFSFLKNDSGEDFLENIKGSDQAPDEFVMQRELVGNLDRALARLPQSLRVVLFLYYKEEFSLKEISEILGKPYNTTKSLYRRALIALKKEMKFFNAPKLKDKQS